MQLQTILYTAGGLFFFIGLLALETWQPMAQPPKIRIQDIPLQPIQQAFRFEGTITRWQTFSHIDRITITDGNTIQARISPKLSATIQKKEAWFEFTAQKTEYRSTTQIEIQRVKRLD